MGFDIGLNIPIHGTHSKSSQKRFWAERDMFLDDRAHNEAYNERMDNTKLQRMIADARAAGIHPLAALGAQTVGPATSAQFMSSGSSSGGRGGGISIRPATNLEEAQTKLTNKQAELVEQQILDSQVARAGQMMTPQIVHDSLKDHEVKKPTHTPSYVLPGGVRLKRHPSSDMEALTNALGEPAEWAMFFPQIIADWLYTVATHERTSKAPEKSGEKNLWRYRFLK